MESLINNFPKQEVLGPFGFTSEFSQAFKKEIILIFFNHF